MSPWHRAALIILLFAVAGGALAWDYWMSGVEQRVAFPHKTHLALHLPCTACHQRAEKDVVAGRPPTALCLGCHMGGETKSEEIKKIRAYGEKGQEIPWKRVWRLPPHVFFPHQVHVTVAQLTCQTCHGPMETLARPPARPLKKLAMQDCIDCHETRRLARKNKENGMQPARVAAERIPTDCITCHR